MRFLDKIGIIVFVGLIILNMITYRSCQNIKGKYSALEQEKEQILTKFDSVLSIPPDTIELPSKIIKKDSLIYITKKIKEPIGEPKLYRDSLVNDSIDIRFQILANELFDINYAFKPVYKYQETVIERKVPYPVEIEKEIKVYQSGLFFNAGLGYSDQFSGKVGLLYLTKKKTTFGLDLVRYGDKNIYIASYGVRF